MGDEISANDAELVTFSLKGRIELISGGLRRKSKCNEKEKYLLEA